MTETIWKYPLKQKEMQEIEMPEGAGILCAQEQDGTPCIWAQVNPHAEKKPIRVYIYETGQMLHNTQGRYIGTIQLGTYVIHIYAEDVCKEWNL